MKERNENLKEYEEMNGEILVKFLREYFFDANCGDTLPVNSWLQKCRHERTGTWGETKNDYENNSCEYFELEFFGVSVRFLNVIKEMTDMVDPDKHVNNITPEMGW